MTVLVTGGTGAMGSWVTRSLVAKGLRPICYDWEPSLSLLGDIRDRFKIINGDVRDLSRLIHAIRDGGVERIVHMAYLILASEDEPHLAYQVNLGGTVNVLEAARIAGVKRVVFTSSKGVFGEIRGDHAWPTYKPIAEDYLCNPTTIYGITKLACERFGLHYSQRYGIDFVALRFAHTYGPGKSPVRHGPMTLPGSILEAALSGADVEAAREPPDDLLYYKDVAKSVVQASFSERSKSAVFHIGCGRAFSFDDVIAAVNGVLPNARVKLLPEVPGSRTLRSYCVMDTRKAKWELGFEADYDLNSGFSDYAIELKRHGLFATG